MAPPQSHTEIHVGGASYSVGIQAGEIWPHPDEFMEHADGKIEFAGMSCMGQDVQGDAMQMDTYYLPLHPQHMVRSTGTISVRILHMCQHTRQAARTFTLWKGPEWQRSGRVVVRHIGDELVVCSQQRLEVTFNYDGTHYDVQILDGDFKVKIKFGDRVVFTRETGEFQVDYFGWDSIQWQNLSNCTRKRLQQAAEIKEPVKLPPHVRPVATDEREKKKLPPPLTLIPRHEDKEEDGMVTPTPTEAPTSPPNVKVRRREVLEEKKKKKKRSKSEPPKARRKLSKDDKKKQEVQPASINNLNEVPVLNHLKVFQCVSRPPRLTLTDLLLHCKCVVKVGLRGSPCVVLPSMCIDPVLRLDAKMLQMAVQEIVRIKVGWKEDPTPYQLTCGQLLACTTMSAVEKTKLKAHILDVLIGLLGA